MRPSARYALAAALLLITPACLIDDEGDRQGYTECGDFLAGGVFETNYCPPGRYCSDPTFSECADGCFSNENCADDQRCVKADGQNVGTCQNESKRPATNPRGPSTQSGLTPCGSFAGEEVTCQPNQFCEDMRYSRCEIGCLSDFNCVDDEECVKDEGADIGSCEPRY